MVSSSSVMRDFGCGIRRLTSVLIRPGSVVHPAQSIGPKERAMLCQGHSPCPQYSYTYNGTVMPMFVQW